MELVVVVMGSVVMERLIVSFFFWVVPSRRLAVNVFCRCESDVPVW